MRIRHWHAQISIIDVEWRIKSLIFMFNQQKKTNNIENSDWPCVSACIVQRTDKFKRQILSPFYWRNNHCSSTLFRVRFSYRADMFDSGGAQTNGLSPLGEECVFICVNWVIKPNQTDMQSNIKKRDSVNF